MFEWGNLKSYKGKDKHNLYLTTLKNNFVEALEQSWKVMESL